MKTRRVTGAVAVLGMCTAVVLVGATSPATASQEDNWHVHDGVEAPAGFFPAILGEDLTTYLQDPAACPDATDKTFLPNGQQANQPLRHGVCMTSDTVIHLASISPDQPAPAGWTLISTGTYKTYYLLTAI